MRNAAGRLALLLLLSITIASGPLLIARPLRSGEPLCKIAQDSDGAASLEKDLLAGEEPATFQIHDHDAPHELLVLPACLSGTPPGAATQRHRGPPHC